MRTYTREDALRLFDELNRTRDRAADVTTWLTEAARAVRISPLDLRIVRAHPAWAFLVGNAWVIDWAPDARSSLRGWNGPSDPLYADAVQRGFIDPI